MNPADSTASILTNLKTWAKAPFSVEMDLMHWFLWTGLILVMVIVWTMIIHELEVHV